MSQGHLVNHIHHPELRSDNTLHVVGVISNPARFHSRLRLYREWLAAMENTPNVKVYTVECAFGDRHHEVTQAGNPQHLQLRTNSEIWIKENMINLGVKHLLPKDWKYVAWVDCDVFFREKHWAQETIHQLQHFPIVQPWSECIDLGPKREAMQLFTAFGKLHKQGVKKQKFAHEPYKYGHVGYSWACTRKLWEAVGGLIDRCILGSADYSMAWACVGDSAGTVYGLGGGFERYLEQWQRAALRVTHGNVGFVNGVIEHGFHGAKKNRYYQSRNQILKKHDFDAIRDIYYDHQGLIQLDGKAALAYEIHKYILSRDEDGTTL